MTPETHLERILDNFWPPFFVGALVVAGLLVATWWIIGDSRGHNR